MRWARGEVTLQDFEFFMDCAFHSVHQYITLQEVRQSLLTFVCSIPPSAEGALRGVAEENEQLMEKLGLVVVMVNGEVIWKVCLVTMVMTSSGECHSPLKMESYLDDEGSEMGLEEYHQVLETGG